MIEITDSERHTQPYSNIGAVWMTFPNGTVERGTCTLVGRNDILTAAHVVYNPDYGGYATSMMVYFGTDFDPASNAVRDPVYFFSTTTFDIFSHAEMVFIDADNSTMRSDETQYDVALIGIAESIGDELGWAGINPQMLSTQTADAVGYSQNGTGMMKETITVQRIFDTGTYASDVVVLGPGASGGPLLLENDVIGVLSTGTAWADIGFLSNEIIAKISENDVLFDPQITPDPPVIIPDVTVTGPIMHIEGLETYKFYSRDLGVHFFTESVSEKNAMMAASTAFDFEGLFTQQEVNSLQIQASPMHIIADTNTGMQVFTLSENVCFTDVATLPTFTGGDALDVAATVSMHHFTESLSGVDFYTIDESDIPVITNLIPHLQDLGVAYWIAWT